MEGTGTRAGDGDGTSTLPVFQNPVPLGNDTIHWYMNVDVDVDVGIYYYAHPSSAPLILEECNTGTSVTSLYTSFPNSSNVRLG